MTITINGQSQDISENLTLTQLLEHLGLSARSLAVAINCEIIPCSQFEAVCLRAGDEVDLVQAVGGG